MNGILFDRRDHELVDMINAYLDRDAAGERRERRVQTLGFHPNGLRELGTRKAARVARAVIGLLDTSPAATPAERLEALRALQAEACSSASSALRLNTARVLIQLMKELLRARGDTAERLRLAHDFNKAASGRPRIVRALLRRHNLLEMPEDWNQRAFDYHVRDSHSSGRKSPTHLIMDAWLKGIRTLKVVYEDFVPPEAARELMAAAEVMGMTIRIGVRFHRRFRGRKVTLVWTPRGFSGSRGFSAFLDQPPMRALTAAGRELAARQAARFTQLVGLYNRDYRPALNGRFEVDVPPLAPAEFDAVVGAGQPSWAHLADCIHRRTVAAFRAGWPDLAARRAQAPAEERAALDARLEAMEHFSPATVLDEWLNGALAATEPAETAEEEGPADLLARLAAIATDYRASIDTRNLSPSHVLQLLHLCEGRLTHLELFKLRTYRPDQYADLKAMNDLREVVNSGNPFRFKRLVTRFLDATPAREAEELACLRGLLDAMPGLLARYAARPLSTFVSSDSSGRSDWGGQHGMGFVLLETLPPREQRACRGAVGRAPLPLRYSLVETVERPVPPSPVGRSAPLSWLTRIGRGLGRLFHPGRREWTAPLESLEVTPVGNVLPLGGAGAFAGNRLGAGAGRGAARPASPLGYLNTPLLNTAFVLAGFIAALLAFQYTQTGFLAWWGAPLWFLVTGGRNILQAVIAGGGLRRYSSLTWKDYVSWTRLCESLFYTGFSVPLVEIVVRFLVLEKGFGLTAMNNAPVVFLVIAVVNGFYLMSHNLYRGLPTAAAYANLGRSVVAAPIAVLYHAGLFWLLTRLGVAEAGAVLAAAASLIAKTASDTAAGAIEGYFDRQSTLRLRRRDIHDVVSSLLDCQAALELSFPNDDGLDLLRRPERLFDSDDPDVRRLAERITVHGLDLVYFHFQQPLAAQALRKYARTLAPEERLFVLRAQNLLALDDHVTRLFVDGLYGPGFGPALAFHLARHRAFRKVLPRLLDVCDEAAGGARDAPR